MILPPSGSKASAKPRRRHRPKPTLFGPDPLSQHYASRLEGVCDYADRLTINSYLPLAQTPGGCRAWWRDMYGSNDNLGNRRLMRPARRLSWRVRGWAQMHGVQIIDCCTGERKRRALREEFRKNDFRPEFLNRVDEIFLFRTLTGVDYTTIAERYLRRFLDSLRRERQMEVILDPGVNDAIGAYCAELND